MHTIWQYSAAVTKGRSLSAVIKEIYFLKKPYEVAKDKTFTLRSFLMNSLILVSTWETRIIGPWFLKHIIKDPFCTA